MEIIDNEIELNLDDIKYDNTQTVINLSYTDLLEDYKTNIDLIDILRNIKDSNG